MGCEDGRVDDVSKWYTCIPMADSIKQVYRPRCTCIITARFHHPQNSHSCRTNTESTSLALAKRRCTAPGASGRLGWPSLLFSCACDWIRRRRCRSCTQPMGHGGSHVGTWLSPAALSFLDGTGACYKSAREPGYWVFPGLLLFEALVALTHKRKRERKKKGSRRMPCICSFARSRGGEGGKTGRRIKRKKTEKKKQGAYFAAGALFPIPAYCSRGGCSITYIYISFLLGD